MGEKSNLWTEFKEWLGGDALFFLRLAFIVLCLWALVPFVFAFLETLFGGSTSQS